MKKALFIFLALLCNGVSFSQTETDPRTGIRFRMDINSRFAEVAGFQIGSPADLSDLRAGDRIFSINGTDVKDIPDPVQFMQKAAGTFLKLTIKRIGRSDLIEISVPRLSVDWVNNRFRSEGSLFMMLNPRQKTSVTPDGYNIEKKKTEVIEMVNSSPDPSHYEVYDVFGGVGCDYMLQKGNEKDGIITMLYDESRDMTLYRTFDFDFISSDDPLMEKNLSSLLERELVKIGLARSPENPDILILINFYSGQKDQFVQPQQIISTRIQNVFNWYWGSIPVAVTESKTQAGYTQMTYLSNINLRFFDAKEIGTSKTPPVIWSGSISQIASKKIFLMEQAKEFYAMVMAQFPLVWFQNSEKYQINHYAYTGIIYDQADPDIIAEVIPGSPAAEAGIQKGDKIQNISGASPGFGIFRIGGLQDGFKYLYVYAQFQKAPISLFEGIPGEFAKFRKDGIAEVVFEIKRNGKKFTYNIKPEDKTAVIFKYSDSSTGTTIN
jgi:membrane-associated protease RseP (regulator of RpoE activity)